MRGLSGHHNGHPVPFPPFAGRMGNHPAFRGGFDWAHAAADAGEGDDCHNDEMPYWGPYFAPPHFAGHGGPPPPFGPPPGLYRPGFGRHGHNHFRRFRSNSF